METVTIKDIARLCGVGVSTVSRALNDHPDINPETKEMIMRVISEHHYIPNNSARNLKRSESNKIAVLMKGITNPFFHGMIKVLEREVEREKYSFLLQHVDEEEDELNVALELEKEKKPCGIIFLGGTIGHTEEKLKQLNTPFVLCTIGLEKGIEKSLYSSVSIDDVKEAVNMVSYLIRMGHERIAFVAAREDDTAIGHMRLEGYKKALSEHGIPFCRELVLYPEKGCNPYSMENGYRVVKQFLESGVPATAFFVISDNTAFGVCKAISEAGKRVPEDYSVAGFDGIEMGRYYCPALTTVSQPCDEMAKESVEILFDLIEGRSGNRHRIFPAELVKRESVRELGKRRER